MKKEKELKKQQKESEKNKHEKEKEIQNLKGNEKKIILKNDYSLIEKQRIIEEKIKENKIIKMNLLNKENKIKKNK